MAKVIPISMIQGMSGRVTPDSDECYVYNPVTGKTTTSHRPQRHRTVPPSEKQAQHFSYFGSIQKQAAQWLNANHPSEEYPHGTEIYQKVMRQFAAQHTIGNKMAFVTHKFHIGELS